MGKLLRALALVVSACSMAICFYLFFSLFYDTETERRLRRENRAYERLYSQMLERRDLIAAETQALRQKDDEIYRAVFHTPAPSAAPSLVMSFMVPSDTVPGRKLISYTSSKVDVLCRNSSTVEEDFLRVFAILAASRDGAPPMEPPLDGVNYARTGASIGMKINPFYKVQSYHGGLDLIAAQGDVVRAAAKGTVSSVTHSRKGMGNVVEIDHGNGYKTRYAHLSDIAVSHGQRVEAGRKIGTVGISGNALVPHLHYEVLKDTVQVDPVNYMFGALSPEEYADIAFMGVTTRQSLD